MRRNTIGIAAATLAAAAAIGVAGAAIASAADTTATPSPSSTATATPGGDAAGPQGASQDTAVTGSEADKVIAAVKAKDSGATITTVRKDPDGSYDALGTKSGTPVFYDVSADLTTVTAGGGGPAGGHGGAPDGTGTAPGASGATSSSDPTDANGATAV